MNIRDYIESGILEAYVLGSASEEEARELLFYKEHYPEVKNALYELETDLERIAQSMAIVPPPGTFSKIEASINELINVPEYEPLRLKDGPDKKGHERDSRRDQYIDVESESSHIRVHKNWKWVFAAVFVLSKIFLICAIYFYLENRQAQQQLQELKAELQQYHSAK